MTWFKTIPPTPDNAPVWEVLQTLNRLYPQEYDQSRRGERRVPEIVKNDSIMLSHSLLPTVMLHAFSTFGALLDPALPLSRRQHELITTTVSTLNRCFY